MQINEECYVAFIDILGFKNLVMKNSNSEVLEFFKEIISSRNKILIDNSNINAYWDDLLDSTLIRIMSDSIVIAIPSRYPDSLAFVADCCRNIQATLLEKKILVRGGISIGMFFANDEIMFGEGLVKAYTLESYAVFPRVIISPDIVRNYNSLYGDSTYIYLTDFILFDNDYYYINYLMCIQDFDIIHNFILYEIENEANPPQIKSKYLWLKSYYNKYIMEPLNDIDTKLFLNNDIIPQ